MTKLIDYPKASLKNCLEVAAAIHSLGGRCTSAMAADKLHKKVSGAWGVLVGSVVRFGLITSKKGMLEITPLYDKYRLAYSEKESSEALSEAFLKPQLFQSLVERFDGRELPVSHFENLLIREFDVPEERASRVVKYFIEGATQTEILGSDNIVTFRKQQGVRKADDEISEQDEPPVGVGRMQAIPAPAATLNPVDANDDDGFSIRIKGPGMDSVISINEEDDLLIVEIMLKKIKKKLLSHSDDI